MKQINNGGVMEPWLSSDNSNSINFYTANLFKSIKQANYWIQHHLESLPREALWWQPVEGISAIGSRVEHVIFVSRALAMLAFSPDFSPITPPTQKYGGWEVSYRSKKNLLRDITSALEQIQEKLSSSSEKELREELVLDVKQLTPPEGQEELNSYKEDLKIPIRRVVVLHHIVEHAAYHAGQLIVVRRLWESKHN